jgi:hypothetical protein
MPEVKIHLELILPAEQLSVNMLIALFQRVLMELVPFQGDFDIIG